MSLDVSPDGKSIVFDHLGDLYILPVSGGDARPLTRGSAFDSQPRFSPDGKTVLFLSDRDGSDDIWTISVDGKVAKRIVHATNTTFLSPIFVPDGGHIVVSRRTPAIYGASFELWKYDLSGGAGVRITKSFDQPGTSLDQWRNALGASASSDGRSLFYAMSRGEFAARALPNFKLVRLDLKSGDTTPVPDSSGGGMRPVVSPDGRWLAYAVRVEEVTGLKLRNLSTGEERWLIRHIDRDDQQSSPFPDRDCIPGYAFAPDGRALYLAYGGHIHRVDIASGVDRTVPMRVNVDLALAPALEFQSRVESGPVFARFVSGMRPSPDGKQIAASAFGTIYVADRRTGKARSLLPVGAHGYEPAWSPDGRQIAYVDWDERIGGSLWLADADGRKPPRRLSDIPGYYRNPTWSPDGTRIIFVIAAQSYARAAPPIDMQRMSDISEWDLQIASVPSRGGQVTRLGAAGNGMQPHFGGATGRIYLSTIHGLESVRLDGSDRRLELVLRDKPFGRPVTSIPTFTISPDGRYIGALVYNQLYVLPTPPRGAEPFQLDVDRPLGPLARLTRGGADQFAWTPDSSGLLWGAGRTVFSRRIADIDFESGSFDPLRRPDLSSTRELKLSIARARDVPVGSLVLKGARVVTMRGDEVIERADVLIKGDRIAAIGPSGTVALPPGATMIDVTGKTIVPGFVDIHAHANSITRGALAVPSYPLAAYLAYGVTTIRDPQTTTFDLFTYQDMIDAGLTIGPRAFSTGPAIIYNFDIRSFEQARDILSFYQDSYRVTTVKAYLVGNRQQRGWVAEAARELRLMPTTEGESAAKLDLTHAIDGLNLEHTIPITPLYDDIVQLIARSGVVYDPTFLMNYGAPMGQGEWYVWAREPLHDDPKIRRFMPLNYVEIRTRNIPWISDAEHVAPRQAADAVKILRAGGSVTIGSHGDFFGIGLHENLWTFVEGGATPMEALRAATITGATALGYGADLGSIEPGKLADLVILDRNPLEDIHSTTAIHYVVKNGVVYDGNTLAEVWPTAITGPVFWWADQSRKLAGPTPKREASNPAPLPAGRP